VGDIQIFGTHGGIQLMSNIMKIWKILKRREYQISIRKSIGFKPEKSIIENTSVKSICDRSEVDV